MLLETQNNSWHGMAARLIFPFGLINSRSSSSARAAAAVYTVWP